MNSNSAERNFEIVPKVIWAMLTMSIFVYVLIAFFLNPMEPDLATEKSVSSSVLLLLGVSLVALTLGLRRSLLNPEKFYKQAKSLQRVKALWFNAQIICWALNESVVVLGFAVAMLNKDPYLLIPFATASLALNFIMFPRFENFKSTLKIDYLTSLK